MGTATAIALLLFFEIPAQTPSVDGGVFDAGPVNVDGGTVNGGEFAGVAPLGSSLGCASCHGTGATVTAAPALSADTYRGSMMAFAGEDPFFLAAWEIARGDDEEVALLCARCHFPGAVVAGRGVDDFIPVDREGIACDLCHRMAIPDPIDDDPLSGVASGNAQFAIGVQNIKIGPFDDAVTVGHISEKSALIDDGRMCGQCHDVTDDKRPRRLLDGTLTNRGTPLERTFSEWKQSAFADRSRPDAQTCQDCHMRKWTGRIAALAISLDEREVASHRIVGSSVWAPLMIAEKGEGPDAPNYLRNVKASAQQTSNEALHFLQTATASLTANRVNNDDNTLSVRVENLTGHKLPTGYSEGRRMWISSYVRRDDGSCGEQTGVFDPLTCEIDGARPPVEIWEMIPGVDGDTPTLHFALVDTILKDNRIPPRGFRPDDDTMPVGKDFPTQDDGSLAHFDDVIIPLGERHGPVVVDVTLQFQATTKEFLNFLVEGAPLRGPELGALFAKKGGGPIVLTRLTVAIAEDGTITDAVADDTCVPPPLTEPWRCLHDGVPPVVVDAGTPNDVIGPDDAGPSDDENPGVGCHASSVNTTAPVGVWVWFTLAFGFTRRRRRASLLR